MTDKLRRYTGGHTLQTHARAARATGSGSRGETEDLPTQVEGVRRGDAPAAHKGVNRESRVVRETVAWATERD